MDCGSGLADLDWQSSETEGRGWYIRRVSCDVCVKPIARPLLGQRNQKNARP